MANCTLPVPEFDHWLDHSQNVEIYEQGKAGQDYIYTRSDVYKEMQL
jgi:hypothetical protein